ncbi:MAG: hypothetical protein MJ155_00370 [Candidatus Saccharibacteria bacterium]|nr:hypothetical protein [Candidatus Saccharibacteria bacterium]
MKNYLFARICRVIGRFLLTLGTVLFIGSLAILFLPKPTQNPSTEDTSLSHQTIHSIINNNGAIAFADTPANNVALTALGIVLAISIIIIFVLVMRHYNDDIRKIIGKISKLTKLSIHQVELLATTLVWGVVVHIAVSYAPLFAIPAITVLILNELLFIFARLGYGCKDYVL